jgi:hypothetical protein
VPALATDTYIYDNVMSDMNINRKNSSLPTVDVPVDVDYLDDLFGFNRLSTCAKNPLQIVEGYVCNNIPQEFSRFGFNLLSTAITAKTILVMGSTWNDIKRLMPGKNSITNSASRGQTGGVEFKRVLVSSASILSNSGALESILDTISGLGFTSTDEFGNLNTRSVDAMVLIPTIAAIVAISAESPNSFFVKSVDFLLSFMLILGIFFAVIIPVIPMIFVLSAITKFMFLMCKTLLLQGFKLTDAIFDRDNDFMSEKVDEVWADWLATTLKLPLTVVGVVLAWLMSNVIIGHVLRHMDMTFITNDGTQGLADLAVSLFFSLAIILVIYNMILSVIESFYDFTVEWILQKMTNSPYADGKAIQWKDAQDVLRTLGR